MYRASAAHKGIDAVEDAASEGLEFSPLTAALTDVLRKNLTKHGLKADIYMMVTELGIEKTRPSDVKPEYIEKIIRAIKDA